MEQHPGVHRAGNYHRRARGDIFPWALNRIPLNPLQAQVAKAPAQPFLVARGGLTDFSGFILIVPDFRNLPE